MQEIIECFYIVQTTTDIKFTKKERKCFVFPKRESKMGEIGFIFYSSFFKSVSIFLSCLLKNTRIRRSNLRMFIFFFGANILSLVQYCVFNSKTKCKTLKKVLINKKMNSTCNFNQVQNMPEKLFFVSKKYIHSIKTLRHSLVKQ